MLECGRGRYRRGRRAEGDKRCLPQVAGGSGGGCQIERSIWMHPLRPQVLPVLAAQLVRGRCCSTAASASTARRRTRRSRCRPCRGRGRVQAHGIGVRAGLIITRNCGHWRPIHQHGRRLPGWRQAVLLLLLLLGLLLCLQLAAGDRRLSVVAAGDHGVPLTGGGGTAAAVAPTALGGVQRLGRRMVRVSGQHVVRCEGGAGGQRRG